MKTVMNVPLDNAGYARQSVPSSEITGRRFGRWTVVGPWVRTARGERKYLCRCDCGTERYVLERSLKSGGSQSCGCMREERAREAVAYELTGQTFGDLTVIGRSTKRTKMGAYWHCRCRCGKMCEATASELVSGKKTSCGCKTVRTYTGTDITGWRFGRLTALQATDRRDGKGSVVWRCRCDCGNETDVSYNNLVYANQQSCGCKKREHDNAVRMHLIHIDGTSIDALRSSKVPSNNTTGVKGVYFVRGRYMAKIVFQKKQFSLGMYDTLAEAAAARKTAEEELNGKVIDFYERWSEIAAADPEWAEENPVRIRVSRDNSGGLAVSLLPALGASAPAK